jgi:mRNA interferase MazF
MVERFDVFLVNLDSTPSSDAKNTRPCVVISPDEINRNVGHVIIAPLSSPKAKYPTRIPVNFLNGQRSVVLDQIRTVDKSRLVKKIGSIEKDQQSSILDCLIEMFTV